MNSNNSLNPYDKLTGKILSIAERDRVAAHLTGFFELLIGIDRDQKNSKPHNEK